MGKEYNLNDGPANSGSDQQMESGWRKKPEKQVYVNHAKASSEA